ncbi:MAG: hypothetical protein AB1648_15215 [Pseudomonadota bacterium]
MGDEMNKRNRVKAGCMAKLISVGLFAAALLGVCTVSANPDFSEVDDILHGERHLLRNDDLLFVGHVCGYGQIDALCQSPQWVFDTADSQITGAKEFVGEFGRGEDWFHDDAVAVGRMFALPNDVIGGRTMGRLEYSDHQHKAFGIYDPTQGKRLYSEIDSTAEIDFVTMADFNYDGYDELVVHTESGDVYVATAKNTHKFDDGLVWTRLGKILPSDIQNPPVFAVVEIATWPPESPRSKVFAGVRRRGKFPNYNGLEVTYIRVNSATLQPDPTVVTNVLSIPAGADHIGEPISLAVGRYGTTDHDQLVVAYSTLSDHGWVVAYDIDFRYGFQLKGYQDLGDGAENVITKSGRMYSRGQFDQAVVWKGGRTKPMASTLRVLSFDSNLNIFTPAKLDFTRECFADFALGRFDRRQKSGGEEPNPNLQVALLWRPECESKPKAQVEIYHIDPAKQFQISLASRFRAAQISESIISGRLLSGDFRGRSLMLGEPTKVVLESYTQPSVVIGAPPMHVDYITPVPVTGVDPTVLNLSAVPASFYSQYEKEEGSTETSNASNTTSWSRGLSARVKAKVTIGDPKNNSFTAKLEGGIEEVQKGVVEKETENYSSYELNMSQKTGFTDQVWYTSSRLNFYLYPVLGQKVCPKDGTVGEDCPEDSKMQAYVMFSAPDKVSNYTLPARSVEWFQPPWEPGNVFSYPASEEQLKKIDGEYLMLGSSSNQTWFTDDSGLSLETKWTSGSSSKQSVGSTLSTTYDVSTSVSGTLGAKKVAQGEFGMDLSWEYTGMTESLNTQTVSLARSTGITVEKPSTFPAPAQYQYAIRPYVLAHLRPKRNFDGPPQLGDLTAFGAFQTVFLADPTDINAGGWWKQAYTAAPDIALNHPARWDFQNGNIGKPECVGVKAQSKTAQCAKLADKFPTNPWLSPFHWMRGLFITHAEFNGRGPHLLAANGGDKLMLQARVYNYSLKSMDAGTAVHVRFYGQPWNVRNNEPLKQDGKLLPSFLIGEDRLGPIPAFSSDGDLNWTLAKTTFDTSKYAGQYLTFWVVVWMEKGGALVREIPGHGLEKVPENLASLAEVPIEEYSNNVGFYKQAFYVSKESSSLARSATGQSVEQVAQTTQVADDGWETAKSKHQGKREFRLKKKKLPSHRVAAGQSTEIRVKLLAGKISDPAVTVVFYDGDPKQGGAAFDAEIAPYLKAGSEYEVSVQFASEECGKHRIFVVAGAGSPSEQVVSYPVMVECGLTQQGG